MADISLLEPTVLRGVVEKLTAAESLTLSRSLPKTAWPFPSVTWDVIRGSRTVAKPNVPNSEAHVVPRLGVSQESAAFVYLREKKVFEPTTIHWIRQPGELAKKNAEAAILREVNDLNQRIDNFVEYACWQALTGTLTLDYPDVQASVNYKISDSHKPNPVVGWGTASPAQIRNDIAVWKRLIRRDGRVEAQDAWATEPTLNLIVDAFADTSAAPGHVLIMSDRMKDEFYKSGWIPGFQGLDWRVSEQVYDTDAGVVTQFVADNALFITNLKSGNAMEIMEGPTADDEAPEGHTGKFSKSWKEKDPSARQILIEYHFLPVITRPEQIIYVDDVTSAS